MVTELADIRVVEGREEAFVEAYREAVAQLAASAGIGAIRLTRSVETPTRFVLLVEWDSVAAHQAFRDSERFAAWRALIGPHFAAAPHVEHLVDVD